jgi:hypothetical protein
MAGGGASLGILLTIPVIALASLALSGIHYILSRKKIKTKYFQIIGITLIILLSNFLFIADVDATPIKIVNRMGQIALNFEKIKLDDLYLEDTPINREIILAAQKKFKNQAPDTAFLVRIYEHPDYNTIDCFGIYYKNGLPKSNRANVLIKQLTKNNLMITKVIQNDSTTFILNPLEIKTNESRIYGFPEQSTSAKSNNIELKLADIDPIQKCIIQREFLAYRIFYWLL